MTFEEFVRSRNTDGEFGDLTEAITAQQARLADRLAVLMATLDTRGGAIEASEANAARLTEILGPQKFESDVAERRPQVGVVTGLAWTPTGGDVMFIEVRVLPSNRASGDLRLTGQLGDVMRESAAAAMTWVRSNAARLGIDHDRILGSDIHVHLPQGGVKKDGPSAGVALTCAIVSALTGRPIRNDVAITGETDLRGPAVQGKRGERFVYLTWGHVDPLGHFEMFRRAKLMFGDVPPDVLRDGLDTGLRATVDLTDDKGGPRCARVRPPAITWSRLDQ